jgi:hypothetical protein
MLNASLSGVPYLAASGAGCLDEIRRGGVYFGSHVARRCRGVLACAAITRWTPTPGHGIQGRIERHRSFISSAGLGGDA